MHFENLQNECKIVKTKNDFSYFNKYSYTCRFCSGARSNIARLVQNWSHCNNLWKLFIFGIHEWFGSLANKNQTNDNSCQLPLISVWSSWNGAVCACSRTLQFVITHKETCCCMLQRCVKKLCGHFANEMVAYKIFAEMQNSQRKIELFWKKQFWSENWV